MVSMDDTLAFWIVSYVTLYVITDPLMLSILHSIVGGQLPRKDTLHHNVSHFSESKILDASLRLQLGWSSEIEQLNPVLSSLIISV